MQKIFVGYESREHIPYKVLEHSIKTRASRPTMVYPLKHRMLRKRGLFTRTWRTDENGQTWDELDGKPFSTEFSHSRFLTPYIAGGGWAVFMDCDILCQTDIAKIFDWCDPKYAVMVVKHEHNPKLDYKMDHMIQLPYLRKNWSSVMLFNCDHPSTQKLTPEVVNSATGFHLHTFGWCKDEEIGELPPEWNVLTGITQVESPKLLHYTEKAPWFPEQDRCAYADEWFREEKAWRESLNNLSPAMTSTWK